MKIIYFKYFKIFLLIVLFIFILVSFYFLKFIDNNSEIYNVKLLKSSKRTLKLLMPSKKCLSSYPTVYFQSKFRNNSNYKLISNTKNDAKIKNYSLSYFLNNGVYEVYRKYFKRSGLIRSKINYGNDNLILIKTNKVKKNNSLSNYIKIYQYINGDYLFQKDTLYKNYRSMKNVFGDDFNYMPETYYYPSDKEDIIKNKFKDYNFDLEDLWLIKPTNQSGGQGIKFFKSLNEIKYKDFVITKYITNIDLINNRKYDLRLYALITGLKPLRIYFNKEGLIRIAVEKYSLDISSINNKFMHLANTDINKYNKKYVYPKHANDESANIWSIATYQKYLNKNKIDWNNILSKIKDIIIKTIISAHGKLFNGLIKNNLNDRSFFNLLGFDILITDKFEPILLEVNNSPSMFIYDKVDIGIKTNLLTDILNIVGIYPFTKEMSKPKNERADSHDDTIELVNNALCELSRPRGDLELIFPLKDNINIYKKYFYYTIHENELFWNEISKKKVI